MRLDWDGASITFWLPWEYNYHWIYEENPVRISSSVLCHMLAIWSRKSSLVQKGGGCTFAYFGQVLSNVTRMNVLLGA